LIIARHFALAPADAGAARPLLQNGTAPRIPVKTAFKIAVSLLIGANAGLALIDYCWSYQFRTLLEAQQLSVTLRSEQRAQSAYFGDSPEIAEVELARLLDSPLLPSDPRERAFRLFMVHARLAKVQQAQGKQSEAEKNFQAALGLMRTAFPDSNASSADDVLRALTTIDNATQLRAD
jgi:hypothetical protein